MGGPPQGILLRVFVLIAIAIVLNGCANSASHRVIQSQKVSDDYLSCSEIRVEKRKAMSVINGVKQDKGDMTGADLVDGVLWFPFNVVAKQVGPRRVKPEDSLEVTPR